MGRIAGPLVGLEHAVGPTIYGSQSDVGVEKPAFAAIRIRYSGVVHIHELRIVKARNYAAKNVGAADLWNDRGRFAGDSLILVLEIKSADRSVKIWSGMAVIQIKVSR